MSGHGQPSFSDLQFQRFATEQDLYAMDQETLARGVDQRWSMWTLPKGDVYWLAPEDVMRYGLTDRMRQMLVSEASGPVQVSREDTLATAAMAQPKPPVVPERPPIEAIGGHTDKWRWDRIVDGDDVLLAIDNKPAVEAWSKGDRIDPAPEFQRIVIPAELLAVIAQT